MNQPPDRDSPSAPPTAEPDVEVLAKPGKRPQIDRMEKLKTLWRGDMPLTDAFWTWAVLGGLVVNVVTSTLFLALISLDQSWPALVVGYGLSLPYNLVALVGVWRAAARHDGPQVQADLARGAAAIWMLVLSVT